MINFSISKMDLSKLNTLIDDIKTQVMPLYNDTGQSTLSDAQSNAPVRSGELRDSGHIETQDNGDSWSVEVTFGDGNGYGSKYGIADGYAWFQELGTRFIAPQPYLAPAFDSYSIKLQSDLKGLF